ncbi:MAG: twin-arginine translocase TatA/TatE family subunit [Nitrospirota bacterium]
MFGLGMSELLIILVIVLLIFGVGKLPEIGANLGKAIKGFKKGMSDTEIDVTPKGKDKDDSSSQK